MAYIPRPEILTRFNDRLLPKSVIRKSGSLFFVTTDAATKKQTWHNLGKTWADAAPAWKKLVVAHRSPAYVKRHLYDGDGGGPIPTLFLKELLANARKNAKARGLDCTVTLDDLQNLALKAGGRCQMTGIPFEYGVAQELANSTTRRKRVWAPSLDRIESDHGYTPENIRIVCMAVNVARQEFGDAVLLRVALGLSNIQYFGQAPIRATEGNSGPKKSRSSKTYPNTETPKSSIGAGLRPIRERDC